MTILLLIDNLDSGGAQRQIVNLAYGLKLRGHVVQVITYSPGEHFQPYLLQHNIVLKHISKEKYSYLGFLRYLISYVKNQRADILCSYLFRPSILALFAKPFIGRTKVVTSERSYYAIEKGSIPKITRFMYFLADAIVTNSYHQADYLKQSMKRQRSKISVISNGIDLSLYNNKKTLNGQDLRTVSIVAIGHINSTKNTKLLIEALKKIEELFPGRFKVNWLGRNYDRTGVVNKYYIECQEMIKKYGLESNWTWQGKQYDVKPFLANADVLVHTSIGEGFPNVIIESLAMGCPVIASNILDHPRIIKQGINGFLFEGENLDSLVAALMGFRELSSQNRLKLSQNARQTAEENFSLIIMTEKYEQLFERILKS